MASRVLHLAVANEIIKRAPITDKNRFKLGIILPDAYSPKFSKEDSHLKIFVCGGTKKTYDLRKFREQFAGCLMQDDLYLGYYLHLIQDIVFRRLVYETYKWNSRIPGNVEKLHNDYHLINSYVVGKYNICNDVRVPENFEKEKIYTLCSFDTYQLLTDLKQDLQETCAGNINFFTEAMAEEFIARALDICLQELNALRAGSGYMEEYDWAWKNPEAEIMRHGTANAYYYLEDVRKQKDNVLEVLGEGYI